MALQQLPLPSVPSFFRATKSSKSYYPHIVTQRRNRCYRPIRCVGSVVQIPKHATRLPTYEPTAWTHDFIDSLNPKFLKEIYKEKVKNLEDEVRALIKSKNDASSTLAVLELIDDIERLGLGYRFQNDIIEALDRIMISRKIEGVNDEEESLHAISLRFRLLREHGYVISQDLFKRFKNMTGGFMECLKEDVKGLLSLYEASFLAFEGDEDLHSAKAFAANHLKKLKDHKNEVLMEQVTHALEIPLYRRMLRFQARCYIDFYEKRDDANEKLLELATLDFNMVQSTLQKDLQLASRWWKDIGLANELSFIRDRLMECFFWSVGVVFEPQSNACLLGLTKVCALITTIDDIYDEYGSLDELELFTNVIKRWDIDAAKHMPKYLQISFLTLHNTICEMGYTLKQGEIIVPVLQKVWGELCEAFLVEAKWTHTKHTPQLEDYLDNAWRSVSGIVILNHAYFLMTRDIKEAAVEALEECHDLLKWSSMIFRLCNDMGTSSDEIARGKTANAISCYMNENGVSEEIAREHISKLIDEAWWKMNESRVAYTHEFNKPFIDTAINLARISHCTYQYGDGHGAPDSRSKDRVLSLLIKPIIMRERE